VGVSLRRQIGRCRTQLSRVQRCVPTGREGALPDDAPMTTEIAIPMLDLKRLHAPIAGALQAAFIQVLESGRFIGGDAVTAFECALSSCIGTTHAVGVSSGTDALIAALTALGVGPGDEVITSAYSFFATAGSIARTGARPVFADIDSETFTIDPASVDAVMTPRTVGIVPVHLFGQCADMDPILHLADRQGLFVLEDAAQAIGATYRGRSAGALGNAGAFSFFPAKNLGALGDAGAVVTNDDRLAVAVRRLREHGAEERYVHHAVGGNFRLDALQAALLCVKLPHLETWLSGRRRVADMYRRQLSEVEAVILPEAAQYGDAAYSQFVIRCCSRDALVADLAAAGIASAIYYPVPLHLQPCFEKLGYRPGDLPESERASREALALPMDPLLTEDQVARIAEVVTRASLRHRDGEERD
jgi:dTDP-4-amino-4,6-dideoxygalactose transaminase